MNSVVERPRVRLSKMLVTHVRSVEVLRYLKNKKGTCRIDYVDFFEEMARRGVIDPATSIIRLNGAAMPTLNVRSVMNSAVSFCLDHELIHHAYPGKPKRFHIYTLTHDGAKTLRDWDDASADGLWARA